MDDASTLKAVLPGYEIGDELGRGAYGVVWAGRHRQLGREVAVKQLSPGLVQNQEVRARFLAEAQVLASIAHPHIVPIYDYVEHDDACALVMERLGGGTVWNKFVQQGFDQRTACAIALITCSGLQGAHQHGVLHRDMKPENILFGAERALKVTDFGIARVLGEDDALATPDGGLLGTPAYMAPEQASGSDIGPPTDVYAAGVMLYELLSGRLPYSEEGGPLAIILRHVNEVPEPLMKVAPATPPQVAEGVMRALARAPEDRFATAEEFGVTIGAAAAAAWGPEWMDGLEIALREPGPILESARRPASTGAGTATVGGSSDPVRPQVELHVGGAAEGLVLSELMPLRRVPVEVPAFPTALTWAGMIVALIALVCGLLGVGSNAPTPSPSTVPVTVAGHNPAAGPVPLNLDRRIPVSVVAAGGAGRPITAQLQLSLGGLPVVHTTSVPFVAFGGRWTTFVDASAARYLVGGKLIAKLNIATTRGSISETLGARAARSPFATLGGVVGIVLTLIVIAYAESLLRALRRGRRKVKPGTNVGMVVVGAFGGVAAAMWGWMLTVSYLTFSGVVIAAALGAVAGLLCGLAARQVGRRTRAIRQANRLVLVARRRQVSGNPALAGSKS